MDKEIARNEERREWVEPQVEQLDAGAAESQRGAVADGGGGFQGS